MRIVFDCRYTRVDRHDGISRFTAGLVGALARLHPVTMLISDHRQLAMLPDLPWQLVSAPTSVREPFVARTVNRLKPDIVFSPMQTMGSWGRRYRLLLTVHDLIYYENRTPPRDLPGYVRVLWRLYHLSWWPQRMLLNRADGIITVSETTRGLIRRHRLTKRPITVVPNAADELGTPTSPRQRPERTSLVYMGSFMPYKNVETLVRAVGERPEVDLHLMSRAGQREQHRLRALAPSARLIFHEGATDAEYAQTLREATALVTASRAEGFGIPIVEAMTQGTPVIVSDIPIFREIGGDAALTFDADDPASFLQALDALTAPGEWERRSERGREQASRFDWDRSAALLLETIEATIAEADSRERKALPMSRRRS